MSIPLPAAGICLAVLLTCASARAQTAAGVTPPIARSSTDVPYPPGAAGDAAVVLELVVGKDGTVSTATVIDGAEPFAEQARSAALTWRFVPAKRDQTPVAARIRARVEFHGAERQAGPTAAPAAPVPAFPEPRALPTASKSRPPPPIEVTIEGERREPGQTTLSKADVREMPGAFNDAFRAIEAFPGVTPLVSGVPYFFVRGAPPNNAGYFVDGIRIPLLFHMGLGQSVIHPGLLERVDFFPGSPPARYGGFAGPIIAGQLREPTSALRGEANLRLVDAGALLEAPFAEGRGSALVAARYGYPGPRLSAVSSDIQLGYWDYQTRESWKLGSRDTIGLLAIGSHDYLATRSGSDDPQAANDFVEQFVSVFHRLDLRYDRALTEGRVRLGMTGGYDSQGAAPTYMTNRSVSARLQVEQRLAHVLQLRGGAHARLDDYTVRVTAQGPREPAVPQSATPPPTNLGAGLHLDFVWRPSPRVELGPGARVERRAAARRQPASAPYERGLLPAVDPRLSARLTLSQRLAWLSSVGLAHQYPSLRLGNVPALMVSVPGFPFGTRRLQSALQTSQGFEVRLPAELVFTATGFYSSWRGLTDLSASCFQFMPGNSAEPGPNDPAPYVCPNNDPVQGHAFGIELMLRRPLSKRLSGWLSYTLSRATRQAHFITSTGSTEVATVASEFDRTHVLNAILGYDLGRGWRSGTTLLFYTGTPYSRLDGSLPLRPYNAYRNPAFYRVDIRLEKRWRLGRNGSVAFVLEGQNVTLTKEVVSGLGMDCESETTAQGGTTRCQPPQTGPITLPSVGVEAFF